MVAYLVSVVKLCSGVGTLNLVKTILKEGA